MVSCAHAPVDDGVVSIPPTHPPPPPTPTHPPPTHPQNGQINEPTKQILEQQVFQKLAVVQYAGWSVVGVLGEGGGGGGRGRDWGEL